MLRARSPLGGHALLAFLALAACGGDDVGPDVDGGGTGPTSCDRNVRFCFEGDVWGCNAAGVPTGVFRECTAGTTCGVEAGVATCLAGSLDGGTEDASVDGGISCSVGARFCLEGDVWRCGASGEPESRLESCDGIGPCVATDTGAECMGMDGGMPPRTCADFGDCDPDEYCDDAGTCQPDVCDPEVSCIDNQVVRCSPDGSGYTVNSTCTDGRVCVDRGLPLGASCQCVGGPLGCFDGDVYNFDSCGTRGPRYENCTEPEVCRDDGDDGARCDLRAVCTSNTHCPSDHFCHLESGECRPDVCGVGSDYCSGNTVMRCATGGSGYTPSQTCTGGQECTTGAGGGVGCLCTRFATQGCYDTEIYWYTSCGVRDTLAQTCFSPQVCQIAPDGSAFCGLPTACSYDHQCGTGRFCDGGTCRDRVCTPYEARCEGDTVIRCNSRGSGEEIGDVCTGGEVCGGGTCRCTPDAYQACSGGNVWNFNSCGTATTRATICPLAMPCQDRATGPECRALDACDSDAECDANEHCDVGRCVRDECAQASRYCASGSVRECDARGAESVAVVDCIGGEVCEVVGGVARCACTPDAARGCGSDGNVYSFDSCGVQGARLETCASGQACVRDGLGARCSCAPGAGVGCGSDGSVREIDSCGGEGAVVDRCTSGEVCVEAGGSASCMAVASPCTTNAYQACGSDGNVRQFDSCSVQGALVDTCTASESCRVSGATASCVASGSTCTANATRGCGGDGNVHQFDSCGAEGALVSTCTASQVCRVSGSDASCVATTTSCTPNAYLGCGTDGNVRQFDSCNQQRTLVEACGSSEYCVASGGSASCVDIPCVDEGELGCYGGDVYAYDTCGVRVRLVGECVGQIECNTVGGDAACRSSVADPDATYYERSCNLVQQLEHPTTLDADCRCSNNRPPASGIPECVSAQYLDASVSFGSGPRVRPLPQPHFNGGFVDATSRELYVGVDWSSSTRPDSGLVMAVNLDSGNRRIVSGGYQDATGFTETGSGPSLHQVIDVERGPDGNLYAVSVPAESQRLEIVRIAPTTGNRTVIWRGQDPSFAHCESGDPLRPNGVQVHALAFAMDTMGRFYLPFTNTSAYGEGVGVIRLAADGSSCSVVTRSGTQSLNGMAGTAVGTGFEIDRGRYQGFVMHEGALYALHDAYLSLIRIDVTNGNRTRVSSASTSTGVIGAGPTNASGIGRRWLAWDAMRNLMWSSGTDNRRMMVAIELATGDRTEAFCGAVNPERPWRDLCLGGAMLAGYQNSGGFWLDPANGDPIVAHENFTLVRVDLRNGNSMKFTL
ncbi:MAG: hypothetical protein R3B99_17655 [Polyangiales bacterium]